MNSNSVRNRRLGLGLLVTAAFVVTIFLVPLVAGSHSITTFDTTDASKSPKGTFILGEAVYFHAIVDFPESLTDTISSIELKVEPDTGGAPPGSEPSFTVQLPFNEANDFDITNLLPLNMRDEPANGRGSTMTITVTWTNIGPGLGGYAVGGYKGIGPGAKIEILVCWKPPILQDGMTPGVEALTTKGDYKSTFTVINGALPPETALFTLQKLTTMTMTINSPADGAVLSGTPITVTGSVNDPAASLSLAADLPSTTLLGPNDFEGADEGDFGAAGGGSLTGLWNVTDDFIDPSKPRAIGLSSLAFTQDLVNNGPLYNFETGSPVSGSATSDTFTVGANTTLKFKTWFDTEPNDPESPEQYDNKFIQAVVGGTPTNIALIVSLAPPGISPGDTFSVGEPFDLVFVPLAPPFDSSPFDPTGAPVFTDVELDLGAFEGSDIAIRFFFDSVDSAFNDGEGWFVDDVEVTGAGTGAGEPITLVGDPTFSHQVVLAEGSNTINIVGTNPYGLSDQASITVSLDTTKPILRLLLTEDLNGNGSLDGSPVTIDLGSFNEDITGDSLLTTLPLITNQSSQVAFGIFKEANGDTLTIKVNGVLAKTFKAADLAALSDTVFSTTINLQEGDNTIVVDMTDKGGQKPDVSDTANTLSLTVKLDTVNPVLTALNTVYAFTALAGTPGDPMVYQVTSTDADTGVAKVEFSVSGDLLLPSGSVPTVLVDQWGTTGNFLYPTVIPSAAPPGALTLGVKATDLAGNVTTNTVSATVSAAMTAWNTCLQKGNNLIALPIQPTDGTIATLLAQKVSNVDATFKASLLAVANAGYAAADPSVKLDADGDVTLANVVETIQYWPGGVTGEIDPATTLPLAFLTFSVDTPGANTLTTLQEGKAYWVKMSDAAFKSAPPLLGFTVNSFSCMTLTTPGQFLTPGDVPPTFNVKDGWNMVGRHGEENTTVAQFLAGVTFVSVLPDGTIVTARTWTSLLAFLNGIIFDYANAGSLSIDQRVTQKLGAFESRFDLADPISRGEGFWLFLITDGVVTP